MNDDFAPVKAQIARFKHKYHISVDFATKMKNKSLSNSLLCEITGCDHKADSLLICKEFDILVLCENHSDQILKLLPDSDVLDLEIYFQLERTHSRI